MGSRRCPVIVKHAGPQSDRLGRIVAGRWVSAYRARDLIHPTGPFPLSRRMLYSLAIVTATEHPHNGSAQAPPRPYLGLSAPHIGEEEIEELLDSIRSGWLTTGPKVNAFQEQLASYLHVRHVRCLSSCTAGLTIGLRMLELGPDDEILLPSMTFVSCANAVEHFGATPVFVDSDLATGLIDLDARCVAGHRAHAGAHAGPPRRPPRRPRRRQRSARPLRHRGHRGRRSRDRRALAGAAGRRARQPHVLLLPRDQEHHHVRRRRVGGRRRGGRASGPSDSRSTASAARHGRDTARPGPRHTRSPSRASSSP